MSAWYECPLCSLKPTEWRLDYRDDQDSPGTREVLHALGNGYFVTRGAAAESRADGVHYPGTYVGGVYNRLESSLDGLTRTDESLVNLPNWLPLSFFSDDGVALDASASSVAHDHSVLDLRHGVLYRELFVEDAGGAEPGSGTSASSPWADRTRL